MSKIEWTDETWNPVSGCSKISAGCKNCYAENISNRFWKDRNFTDIELHHNRLFKPSKWKKPLKVFVNSMSDLFHEMVPFNFIDSVYKEMNYCNQHIFQVLTKRPKRALEYYKNSLDLFEVMEKNDNIWFGVSVEDVESCERIGQLMAVPANIRWVSFEPLIEYIDFYETLASLSFHHLDWVVIGAESGHKRRECKIEWIADIVTQANFFNIPVFVKQIHINGKVEKDISKFPQHLRIREFPKT